MSNDEVKIPKDELGKVVEALLDTDVTLHSIEVQLKGVKTEIEEITTKLWFQERLDEELKKRGKR